ncbi:MAG: hypothetical protein PHP00_15620 [Thiotrichaceae bacterium]|nr:hypothetical protein [Thiotrichaceae bacterium]
MPEFWNRMEERGRIHNTIAPCRFMYISSPPFCGKTSLLQQLKTESNQLGWDRVLFFSLSDVPISSIYSKETFITHIAKQLGFNNFVDLQTSVANNLENILILIDDIHLVEDNSKLRNVFSHSLQELIRKYKPTVATPKCFRVVIAGSYITSHGFILNIPLTNFKQIELHSFKKQDIRIIIEKYLTDAGRFLDNNPDNIYTILSQDISSLSCGHPKAIIALVEDMVEYARHNFLTSDYIANNQVQLFNSYVKPLLDNMIVTLSLEFQRTLTILSTFNSFDAGIVSFLQEKKLIEQIATKPYNVMESLKSICRKELNGYHLDPILMKLLRKYFWLQRCDNETINYKTINSYAIEYFDGLITDNVTYEYAGTEYAYHSLYAHKKLQTQDRESCISDLTKLFKYFQKWNPDMVEMGLIAFQNYLMRDKNIQKLVEETNLHLEELLQALNNDPSNT